MRVIIGIGYAKYLLLPGTSVDDLMQVLDGAIEVDAAYDKDGIFYHPSERQNEIHPPLIVKDDKVRERPKKETEPTPAQAEPPKTAEPEEVF